MPRFFPMADDAPRGLAGLPGRPSPAARALLITGDSSAAREVGEAAASIGRIALEVVPDEAGARDRLAAGTISLLVVHLVGGPGDPGLVRLIREARQAPRPVEAVVIGDGPHPVRAADLFDLEVADCLTRPIDRARLAYLLDILTLREPQAPAAGPGDPSGDPLGRIAGSQAPLLLIGEAGTGKTRLAGRIHGLSTRRDRPFLVVDCAAPKVESEIFGSGTSPGAVADPGGKLAGAGDGTLLLDEVDALPMGLQARLLNAIEQRAFWPSGPGAPRPPEARLIAATRRPLELEVARGRFRADLYYRLNVLSMTLPPLRERVAAIPGLAREFLDESASVSDGRPRSFSPAAMLALQVYAWPGNIRELRDVVGRVATAPGAETIEPADLPGEVRMNLGPLAPPRNRHHDSLARSRQESERRRIEQALANQGNNRVRAAAELGISRVTLYRKLRKYGMMGADADMKS